MKWYTSPRWSQEILDCSMPMTFDTYNKCSYNCLYCFSYYQKSHSLGCGGAQSGKQNYQVGTELTWVNPARVKRIFNLETDSQFGPYVKSRYTFQWGGLADQFDEYEKQNGVTLELLKFFKEINYPICFSTKAVWWLEDDRYLRLFRNQDNWNVKFSIINLDPSRAHKVELGCPTPQERLAAIKKYSKLNKGGVTLRLRPFIIGLTNMNNEYLDLIKQARSNGATACTTEFFCVESRADDRLKERFNKISNVLGFDILSFYRKYSRGSGYLRLNKEMKLPYVVKMKELCDKIGMRFYVSDAHCKEFCHGGSCCGLPETWKYSRGQFTEALVIAKKNGEVRFSDIFNNAFFLHNGYDYVKAEGFNTNSIENRISNKNFTMYDYIRHHWNNPKTGKSPFRYFGGILIPVGLDKEKNLVYKYNPK